MADVTLKPCKCGGEPCEAMQEYTYAVSVHCSVCGHGTRWCVNAAQAWAEWGGMCENDALQAALAAAQARIAELEAEVAALKARRCGKGRCK